LPACLFSLFFYRTSNGQLET